MSKKMNVSVFKEKVIDCIFETIDAAINECEESEKSSFVISFKDGSKFKKTVRY